VFKLAFQDLSSAFKMNELSLSLAWTEVRLKYIRTKIGPFWETLSLAILLFTLAVLWSKLWKIEINEYLPHLVSGMIIWRYMALIITDGCLIFTRHDYIFKSVPMPFSVLVIKHIYAGIFLFLHHLPIIIIFNLILKLDFITINLFYLIYSVPIFLITSYSAIIILAITSTRFRDIHSLTASLVSVLVFFTPIFWTIDQMGEIGRKYFVTPNIIYHYIEIFRKPLIGHSPNFFSVIFTFIFTILIFIFSMYLLNKYKKRIIFWI
jgi:ABC-type polysaccharide/polyol phosphate export permease